MIRINVQDRARALRRHPREDDRNEIETERVHLRVQLEQFAHAGVAAGVGPSIPHSEAPDNTEHVYDHLDEEGEVAASSTVSGNESEDEGNNTFVSRQMTDRSPGRQLPPEPAVTSADPEQPIPPILPENVSLQLPSVHQYADGSLAVIEQSLRVTQMERHLQNLRELIAEKSFLFSHVMRVAPRKAVRTRARANIAKLNLSITNLCRAYSKSRSAILRLGADPDKHPILLRTDVRASTAILDPNEPGSTTNQLSWIWQVPGGDPEHSGSLTECTCPKIGNILLVIWTI